MNKRKKQGSTGFGHVSSQGLEDHYYNQSRSVLVLNKLNHPSVGKREKMSLFRQISSK
jgi:hypothetical protein